MKIGIYTGSFNPFHRGHIDVLLKASKVFDKIIVARGSNPLKECSRAVLNLANHSIFKIVNAEVIEYEGLLADYLATRNDICAIIKGLRNSEDFEYEKVQQYYNEDLEINLPVIYFIADRSVQHISGSGERMLAKLKRSKDEISHRPKNA